jgi:hypothetical protein
MRIKNFISKGINHFLSKIGLRVIPMWKWKELNNGCAIQTSFRNEKLILFQHPYNCGGLSRTATERTVELAIANIWLETQRIDSVTEIGAVTPYYWPGRIEDVVDPADAHLRVKRRASIFDVDLSGRNVLSISTFEHIGSGEYGLEPDHKLLPKAVDKLILECESFLVSVPAGYNPNADRIFFGTKPPPEVEVYFFIRSEFSPYWIQVETVPPESMIYGPGRLEFPYGANAVAFWEKRGFALQTEGGEKKIGKRLHNPHV